jgi:amino acid/amide ABC transporter substrate-binding protein, HAAT family (TC 3.A.1.4.-)
MGLAKAKGIDELTPAMVEGFINAKVLVEGLRRASPKPDRARMLAALEGMRKFDLGGLELSYSATDHSGLAFTDLSIVDRTGASSAEKQLTQAAITGLGVSEVIWPGECAHDAPMVGLTPARFAFWSRCLQKSDATAEIAAFLSLSTGDCPSALR